MTDSFSKRHGYSGKPVPIRIHEDAPRDLREAIKPICEECGISLGQLRDIVCRVLRKSPDPDNWSEPNIGGEVQSLLLYCDWFRVYDIIEAIYRTVSDKRAFASEINEVFEANGIGWQLKQGVVEVRGGTQGPV